jgi:hypothetical protein
MRKSLGCLLLLTLAATSVPADEIEFQYTLASESAAKSPMQGFDKSPNTLQVRLKDKGHVYVITSEKAGYRIAYPAEKPAPVVQSVELPPIRIVHMANEAGVQRVYLVVSSEPVAELEEAVKKGGMVSETLALTVRNRHSGDSLYTRELRGDTTVVKYRATAAKPTVVEEITLLRTAPPAPAAAAKGK